MSSKCRTGSLASKGRKVAGLLESGRENLRGKNRATWRSKGSSLHHASSLRCEPGSGYHTPLQVHEDLSDAESSHMKWQLI